MDRIPKTISLDELNLIVALFKQGYKQRVSANRQPDKMSLDSIEGMVNRGRERMGTLETEGYISTNTISKLSPNSKHRRGYESKIRSDWAYFSVPLFIAKCLHCNLSKAEDVYLTHIIESGISPFDFFNPNEVNLAAIRFSVPKACGDHIYIAFTSDDYNDMFELDDDNEDIWTVKTFWTYNDVLKGKVTLDAVTTFLTEMACGDYVPVFLNTLVYVNE